MARRTRSREIALQVLFEKDLNSDVAPDQVREFVDDRLRDEDLRSYALQLIDGVETKGTELDQRITDASENWSLNRMAAVDRGCLRIALFEMLFCEQMPPRAAIDEAIELAKRYGTADSKRFVNGILDRVYKELCHEEASADAQRPE